MSIPLAASKISACGVSIKSRIAKSASFHDDPDSGIYIQTLSATSTLDSSLCQTPTRRMEFEATSESTYISAPPTGDAIEICAAQGEPKPAAITSFAPTAGRLDATRRPHTPFRRPDTPYPRLSRPSIDERPVSQQTPTVVLQTAAPSITCSKSYYCDTRREDYKHAMFLAWLDRR